MTEHANKRRQENRKGKPFVTISYEVGALGMSVVESLFKYLQKYDRRKEQVWNVFDKGLAMKVLEDFDLPESVLPYITESTSPEIEDFIESAIGLHPAKSVLVYKMNRTIFRLAEQGYVIIVGRGGSSITSGLPKGLHVRLTGLLENRVRYFKDHFKLEEKEAREFITLENRRRGNYFRKYFGRDINDPLLYDLIINTDRLSIPEIVREIGGLVLKREMDPAGLEKIVAELSLTPASDNTH